MSAIYRQPRRAAAIQSQRLTNSILKSKRGVRAALPPPPPPRPVGPNCMVCNTPVTPHDEFERCLSCLGWAHHACIDGLVDPYDRQCRGLCGHDPNPQHPGGTCPSCGQQFRHLTIGAQRRWLRIFRTRAWRAYIRRRGDQFHDLPNRMRPTIGPNNRFFDSVYRPRLQWFVTPPRIPQDLTQPVEETIRNPGTLIYGATYNNGNNGPFRLHDGSWTFYQNTIDLHPRLREFRNAWFIIHPSRGHLARNDLNQRYMFSELNYIMHSNRDVWKRFCRIFDDLGLNLANL